MTPFQDADVERAFWSYPPKIRRKLLALRELIFRTADLTEGVGEIEESLRWGEPAYLTAQSKSGSTIRVGWKESSPSHYAMNFHCQTNLVETFKATFPKEFTFEGNRAIVFHQADAVSMDSLAYCVAAALTYHRDKVRAARRRCY